MRFFRFVCCLLLGAVASSVVIGSGITQGVTFQQGGTTFGAGTILNLIQGTGMTITHTFTGGVASYTLNSTSGGANYQTVQQGGVSLPQEPILNFPSNMTCVDNPGNTSTDCTPSGGGGGSVPTTGWTLLNATPAFLTFDNFASPVAVGIDGQSALEWALAYQPIPGATYTVTGTVDCRNANPTTNTTVCGFFLTDGTKLEGIAIITESGGLGGEINLVVYQVPTVTSGGSQIVGPTHALIPSYATFKVQDNGTNRVWSYYSNGGFVTALTEASGTFLTPTGVGIGGVNPNTLAYFTETLNTWAATSP
jgi:hypothetical protein